MCWLFYPWLSLWDFGHENWILLWMLCHNFCLTCLCTPDCILYLAAYFCNDWSGAFSRKSRGWVLYRITSVTFCLKLFILLNTCGMQSEHHWRVADTEALGAGDLFANVFCVCRGDEPRGSSAPRKSESGIMKLTTWKIRIRTRKKLAWRDKDQSTKNTNISNSCLFY